MRNFYILLVVTFVFRCHNSSVNIYDLELTKANLEGKWEVESVIGQIVIFEDTGNTILDVEEKVKKDFLDCQYLFKGDSIKIFIGSSDTVITEYTIRKDTLISSQLYLYNDSLDFNFLTVEFQDNALIVNINEIGQNENNYKLVASVLQKCRKVEQFTQKNELFISD